MSDSEEMSLLLVDDHGHSTLAMLALGAVKPHRSGVIDFNGPYRRGCCAGGDRHEARVDTRCIGVEGNGLARVIEVRLSDGVICGRKLKLYHISFSCDYRVGRVCESSVGVSDLDNMDGGSCRAFVRKDIMDRHGRRRGLPRALPTLKAESAKDVNCILVVVMKRS